jgi:hypothetical protein
METTGDTEQAWFRSAQHWFISLTTFTLTVTLTLGTVTQARSAAPPPVVPGETFGHQTHCFRLTPYEDELLLEVAQVAPAGARYYVTSAQWWGNGHYFLQAAGSGRSDGTRLDLTLTFFNHTELNGNHWGTLSLSMHRTRRQGPWSVVITGDGRPGGGGSGTPYGVVGALTPKPCDQLGNVPPGDPPNLALAPAEF